MTVKSSLLVLALFLPLAASPVLTPAEMRQALLDSKCSAPPRMKYQFFVCVRALKRCGFTPSGVQDFWQVSTDALDTYKNYLEAMRAGLRWARQTVWDYRGWDEAETRRRLAILDQASLDLDRVPAE